VISSPSLPLQGARFFDILCVIAVASRALFLWILDATAALSLSLLLDVLGVSDAVSSACFFWIVCIPLAGSYAFLF